MRWPNEREVKRINDVIHSSIELFNPLSHLVDTFEFQRLRLLKQVGIVDFVYPNCKHTRFEHSLGVFQLSWRFLKRLIEVEPDVLISAEDKLAVCTAALLHDIGHGPFSHLYDNDYAKLMNKSWTHEEMSQKIVERLLYRKEIRKKFEVYFGANDAQYERNVAFVKEMIGSKPFYNEKGEWNMVGRSPEKAFLYDIVCNRTSGYDVDKLDYLMRDSKSSNVGIDISRNIDRILFHLRLVKDSNYPDMTRVGFSIKIYDTIKEISLSRQKLHLTVYQHWKVRCMEVSLLNAMKMATPYLFYRGSDRKYRLDEVVEDIDAFLKTSDSLFYQILNSNDDNLNDARNELLAIIHRRIKKKVFVFQIRNDYERCSNNCNDYTPKQITDVLTEKMRKKVNITNRNLNEKFMLLLRISQQSRTHEKSPINYQFFFDHEKISSDAEIEGYQVQNIEWDSNPTVSEIALFVDREIKKEDVDILKSSLAEILQCDGLIESINRIHVSY